MEKRKWEDTEEASKFQSAAQEFRTALESAAIFSRNGRFLGLDDSIVEEALNDYRLVTGREFGDHPELFGRSDWARAIQRVVRQHSKKIKEGYNERKKLGTKN